MNIIINGRETEISDENMELFQELLNRIVNADVAGVTGNMDFDVTSPSNDISMDGALHITYGIFRGEVGDSVEPMDDIGVDGFTEPMDM